MSRDPVRIVDGGARSLVDGEGAGSSASVSVRDLRIAREVHGATYDVEAGLRRFSASLAAGAAGADLVGGDLPGGAGPVGPSPAPAVGQGAAGAPGAVGAPALTGTGALAGTGTLAGAGGWAPAVLSLKAVGLAVLGVGALVAAGTVAIEGPTTAPAGGESSSRLAATQPTTQARVFAPEASASEVVSPIADAPVGEATSRGASSKVDRQPRGTSAAPIVEPAAPVVEPAAPIVEPAAPVVAPPRGASIASSSVRPSVKPEMDHLAQVRAAASPAAALALAEEGHARFPGGVFWQEREAIAIDALGRVGRGSAARSRAEAFLARHPESPYAGTLRRLSTGAASTPPIDPQPAPAVSPGG